jgi:hypothetical protein
MNMKKRLIKMAIVMAAVMAVYSCHKNENVPFAPERYESSGITEIIEPALSPGPGHPGNPYDSIGAWHNEILDYIHRHGTGTAMVDEQEISRLIVAFALQRWGYADMMVEIPVTSWNEDDGIDALQQELVQESGLSEQGGEQLRMLLETITNHSLQEGPFSYHGLKTGIMGLEQQWMDSPSLPVWDTSRLLMAASVARHSAYYWSGNGTTPQIEPWNPGPGQPGGTFLFRNVVRFIATVQWDMGGFISGYAGGGLRDAAGKAAGASGWIHGFFDYGVPGGW